LKSDKKHNYFYRITNQINWKYYFGIHSTNSLDDGYLGTGKLIKRAIKFYGKENFVKTIIADYPTRKEASDHEKLAVTKFQIEDQNCYNVRTGGDNENVMIFTKEDVDRIYGSRRGIPRTDEIKERISKTLTGKSVSEETRKLLSKLGKERNLTGERSPNFGKPGRFAGKHHSEESKQRISDSNVGQKRTDETKEKQRQKAIGRNHTEETKQVIREKRKQQARTAKFYSIDGEIFHGKKQICDHFNLEMGVVQYRLKNETIWKNWKILDYHQENSNQFNSLPE